MIRTDLVHDLKNGGIPAIRPKCCFRVKGFKERNTGDQMVVHQHPDELQGFLDFITDHGIKSYTELGTQEGGLFAVIAQHIEGFEGVALDYMGGEPLGFKELAKQHNCTFINANAREYLATAMQDLTFIDTNTRYRGMKGIYRKAASYSKFVAFHDITDSRWGAKALWQRIKARNPGQTQEWICGGPGIGVVMAPFH